jgi:mRNA interferase RelE/StbE
VPGYRIDIRPRAARSLRRLDAVALKAVVQVIDSLEADPRPVGATALVGHRPYSRVRSGDYRIVYVVDDAARVVTDAAIGHRREIYRNLDL